MDDPYRTEPPDSDDELDTDDVDTDPRRRDRPQVRLDGLTVAGITKRRVAWLLGAIVVAWIVIVFARQMGDAASIAAQADRTRLDNAAAAADVAALQGELDLVQRQTYVEQQARGIGLGGPKDHAFVIDPDASPLPATAPGSAAVRLGAPPIDHSPLDSWLELLFGPTPAN
ncbi:MAG: hypothetical protein ACHQ3P_02345 [Candidatus Limnocylindrales bacterium]